MNSTNLLRDGGTQPVAARTLELFVATIEDYAIFMLDPDGNVVSWNRGAQKIKGYRAEEIIGRHFSIFYENEDLAAHKPQLELESAARLGRIEDEGWRVRKDGSRFWANVVITAVRDSSGMLVGFAKVTRDTTEQIQLAERERSRALAAQAHISREEEQRRIARELHDDLGQQLVALKMEVSELHTSLATKKVAHSDLERITRFVTRIDAIINSVRRIAADLRPPLLDDLGLTAAIEWVASDTERRHGFSVVHNLDIGDLELDGRAASSVFRVVQEALNNIVRHAHASRVDIRLFVEGDHLQLQIHDDGVGIELADSRKLTSFGLLGMGERIHMLGGKIAFHSKPGSGFGVDVSIPLANVAVRSPRDASR